MKRRRVAKELKALKELDESWRTDTAEAESVEADGSSRPKSTETDGVVNNDTDNHEKRTDDPPDSKHAQIQHVNNQTTSNSNSKKKRNKKKKKIQNSEKPNGEETAAQGSRNSNTEETNLSDAKSSSDGKAKTSSRDGTQAPEKVTGNSNTNEKISNANSKSSDKDAGSVNRDGSEKLEHKSSQSNSGGLNVDAFWKLNLGTKSNYVPATEMIDRLRNQARPKVTKAFTPMARSRKEKKPETDRLEECLRLAIVDVDNQMGGLSEAVQGSMEEHILRALDAHLDKMQPSEKPPILIWSGPVDKAYRVDCIDKLAADWLTATVSTAEFFPGQRLCVVKAEDLKQKKAKLLKVTVWVPGKPEDFEVLSKRIGRLNPTLQTSEWIKFRCEEKDNGQLISFGMPEAHLIPMEALECTAFCGTKLLHFRVKNSTVNVNDAQ